jgi:hypothetical protein
MSDVAHHVHVGGVYFLTFFATLYVINVLLRLWTARHGDNPVAKAIAFGI